jgi:hypothetical protein
MLTTRNTAQPERTTPMKDRTATELVADWGTAFPYPDSHDMPRPQIWEIYGKEWVEYPHEENDVYFALLRHRDDRRTTPETKRPQGFALITTGWAAPLDENGEPSGAPSEHPKRRHLALGAFLSRDGSTASLLRFDDDGEEVESDDATGNLAGALDLNAATMWGAEWVTRLAIRATETKSSGLISRLAELLQNYDADPEELAAALNSPSE